MSLGPYFCQHLSNVKREEGQQFVQPESCRVKNILDI